AEGARLRPARRRGHRHPWPLVRRRERLRVRLGADRRGPPGDRRPCARSGRGVRGGAPMSDRHESERGALETAAALRGGELDVEELAERTLVAARTTGAEVGAFAHLLEDLTREQAGTAATQLAESRRAGSLTELADRSPLLGVPLPVKDLTQIAGAPFEAGSTTLAGNIATVTDGVAQNILDGGTLT